MATLKTLGDWLKGSGWVQALVQADLATPGTADSFLQAAHVMRTRRVHQVRLAALYILNIVPMMTTAYCVPEKEEMFLGSWNGVMKEKMFVRSFGTGQLL